VSPESSFLSISHTVVDNAFCEASAIRAPQASHLIAPAILQTVDSLRLPPRRAEDPRRTAYQHGSCCQW
jgi:hypothetical protein